MPAIFSNAGRKASETIETKAGLSHSNSHKKFIDNFIKLETKTVGEITMRALIGHTGFVGTNLASREDYTHFYNSANGSEMRGKTFNEVVCAGVSAIKWLANKNPSQDWQNIRQLIENLAQIKTRRFVLISTVDVYQSPQNVTEINPADLDGSAYGSHRARLEAFVIEKFSDCLIVRLPALYGEKLKKNALYDLINDNMVESIDPYASFQWYDVRRLAADIRLISESNVRIINICAEPIPMHEIGDKFFPGKLRTSAAVSSSMRYDVRTQHAKLLGGEGLYHFSSDQVLSGIQSYLESGV